MFALFLYMAVCVCVLLAFASSREFRQKPSAFVVPIVFWPALPLAALGLAALVVYGTIVERKDRRELSRKAREAGIRQRHAPALDRPADL